MKDDDLHLSLIDGCKISEDAKYKKVRTYRNASDKQK